ncbi:MAG: hypothetical protein WAL63_08080 [Solirubrobacteraceae bacterium]
MSPRKPPAEESTDLIISGKVGALRDLVEPPPLSDLQLKIIHWYEELARPLSGPRSGNERGPAQQPPWVKRGPRVETIELVGPDRDEYHYVVDGSGLDDTTDVLLDGGYVRGWQAKGGGQLRIPIPDAIVSGGESEVQIEIRTRLGDIVLRADGLGAGDLS